MKFGKESLTHMKQWVFDFLARESPIQATSLAVTCWHIWESRSDARNGKGHLHPIRVATKVRAYVGSIVQFCFKPVSARKCESSASWIPPPTGGLGLR